MSNAYLKFEDTDGKVSVSIDFDETGTEDLPLSHVFAISVYTHLASLPSANLSGPAEGMKVINDLMAEMINKNGQKK